MGPFCILVRGDLDESPSSTHAAAKLPVRSRAARLSLSPSQIKKAVERRPFLFAGEGDENPGFDRIAGSDPGRRSRPQGEAQGWAESIPLPRYDPHAQLVVAD